MNSYEFTENGGFEKCESDESDTLFRQRRLFQQPIFNLTKAEKKEERDSLTHSTHTSSKNMPTL